MASEAQILLELRGAILPVYDVLHDNPDRALCKRVNHGVQVKLCSS